MLKKYGFLWPFLGISFFVLVCASYDWQIRQKKICANFEKYFYAQYPATNAERQRLQPEVVDGMFEKWNIVVKGIDRLKIRVAQDNFLSTLVETESIVRHAKFPRPVRKWLKKMPYLYHPNELAKRVEFTRYVQEVVRGNEELYKETVLSAYNAGYWKEARIMPMSAILIDNKSQN